jgi:hypothetical protein
MAKKKSLKEEKEVKKDNIQQDINPPQVYQINGWSCVEELADEVYSSIHSGLLQGNLVYALKCQEIPRLVITQRVDTGEFMVGEFMPGWTAYYPRVPYQFLYSDILEDMKKLKLPKETIDNYILVLKNYENFSN